MNNKSAFIIAISLFLSVVLAGALIAGAIWFNQTPEKNIAPGAGLMAPVAMKEPSEPKTLTVSAVNYLDVEPDFAMLNLSYSCQFESTAKDALDKTSGSIESAVNVLIKNGVKPADIQTTGVSVYYESYNGYFSSNGGLNIKIRDIDSLSELLDELYGISYYQSCWYSFGITDPEQAYKTAMLNAIDEAKVKAEIIADGTGLKLGEVIAVDDSYDYGVAPMRYYDTTQKGGGGVMSGTMQVQASVKLTYALK